MVIDSNGTPHKPLITVDDVPGSQPCYFTSTTSNCPAVVELTSCNRNRSLSRRIPEPPLADTFRNFRVMGIYLTQVTFLPSRDLASADRVTP